MPHARVSNPSGFDKINEEIKAKGVLITGTRISANWGEKHILTADMSMIQEVKEEGFDGRVRGRRALQVIGMVRMAALTDEQRREGHKKAQESNRGRPHTEDHWMQVHLMSILEQQ